MMRRFPGLSESAQQQDELPDGVYLVRVERFQYRWDKTKSCYALRLVIAEPKAFAGRVLSGRLYCTERALWKLSWFLRDFGYDAEMLGRDELDEKQIVGLNGVVKLSHTQVSGRVYVNFDGFAPAVQWEELGAAWTGRGPDTEVA
jgi:hypothetical protein